MLKAQLGTDTAERSSVKLDANATDALRLEWSILLTATKRSLQSILVLSLRCLTRRQMWLKMPKSYSCKWMMRSFRDKRQKMPTS
jgi:hypothetical protein